MKLKRVEWRISGDCLKGEFRGSIRAEKKKERVVSSGI